MKHTQTINIQLNRNCVGGAVLQTVWSSSEKHIIFVIKSHKITRLLVFFIFFLDYHFAQDRLPSVLEYCPQVQGFDAT